jgi:HAE1 family hydrophobic/amphiphilic exporter-1
MMKRLVWTVVCLACAAGASADSAAPELRGPRGLKERIAEGKLPLGLSDAVQLVLLNNTDVQVAYLDFDDARYANLGARRGFDPLFSTSFNSRRRISPTTSALEGAETLDAVSQDGRFSIGQTLPFSGTRYDVVFTGSKADTNSRFSTFNPAYSSDLTLRLTQPLLGPQGPFATRAVILRAEETLKQSRATLEERLSRAVVDAVGAYWETVEAAESLAVARSSLELAEATYQRDKRALELGALPPLDIHRSESTVATRRLQVIQAEYALKRSQDRLRRLVGADLDPEVAALDLVLTEPPVPSGELLSVDFGAALEQARSRRPELESLRHQLAATETNLRVARGGLRPDVSVSAFYSTNGRGGNAVDPTTVPPTIVSRGGFGQSLEQLRSLDFNTYGLSVSLSVPFRNRGAEAQLGQAEVDRQRSLYRLRNEEQAVAFEVRSAVDDLEKAKLSLSVAGLARDLARKTLEAEQRKRELGENTLFLVLEAQAGLASAELSFLRAAIEYQKAVTAVARAAGTLLERHNVRIGEPAE